MLAIKRQCMFMCERHCIHVHTVFMYMCLYAKYEMCVEGCRRERIRRRWIQRGKTSPPLLGYTPFMYSYANYIPVNLYVCTSTVNML